VVRLREGGRQGRGRRRLGRRLDARPLRLGYKGKRKDLAAAYSQLNGYREALGNPPLLVVCDLARFEIHTNFTNTVPRVYRFTLDDLAADPGEPLRILRAVFTDPETLRPTRLREELTERAAKDFADLATALRSRGHHPHAEAARDLDRLRTGWLNPPGLSDADLTKRTLTNLYNARPTWLAKAHERLDVAVLAAYGWPTDIEGEDLLARLLRLNLARAEGEAKAD
jgi:hypothetical protein